MKLTLKKLAELTSAKVLRGDLNVEYTGVASLLDAQADEISFLGNEKYFKDFLQTHAGVVIAPPNLPELPSQATAILEIEGNPSVAFNTAVKYFLSFTKQFKPGVHPTAVVDESAQFNPDKVCIDPHAVIEANVILGDGCHIGVGAYIATGAILGNDCRLHAHVVIRERCRLGNRVIIQPNATIGADGFGYQLVDGKYVSIEQAGIVELCDDVEIGANTTIDRARFGKTIIGQDTKIDNLVQIGHNCVIGEHTIIVSQSGVAGSTKIGNYVTIAAQCGIVGHLNIGDYLMMGARTGVLADLEGGKGKVYWGTPADTYTEARKQFVAIRKLPQLIRDTRALKIAFEKSQQNKSDC